MKNSIKSGSFNRTVGGLIFFLTKDKRPEGIKIYPSVHAWCEAGHPDKCFIYDSLDTLTTCGIPIIDAAQFNGISVRQWPLRKPGRTTVVINGKIIKPTIPARLDRTTKGFAHAETKDHHKLSYG